MACWRREGRPRFRALLDEGERLVVPALVLYEWWRGPRLPEELAGQEALLPEETALAFGAREAAVAGALYRRAARPRGRELDLAIAAHAVVQRAPSWTLNGDDFADLPDVMLVA